MVVVAVVVTGVIADTLVVIVVGIVVVKTLATLNLVLLMLHQSSFNRKQTAGFHHSILKISESVL